MRNRKPVFFKASSEGESQPQRDAVAPANARGGAFSRIFGALKGTVTIAPGDLPDEPAADPTALRASADPVLAELWSNPADAVYDDL